MTRTLARAVAVAALVGAAVGMTAPPVSAAGSQLTCNADAGLGQQFGIGWLYGTGTCTDGNGGTWTVAFAGHDFPAIEVTYGGVLWCYPNVPLVWLVGEIPVTMQLTPGGGQTVTSTERWALVPGAPALIAGAGGTPLYVTTMRDASGSQVLGAGVGLATTPGSCLPSFGDSQTFKLTFVLSP